MFTPRLPTSKLLSLKGDYQMNTEKPVELTGNFISILRKREDPYSLQDIKNILDEMAENSDDENSLMFDSEIPVVVNYLIDDPVSKGKVSMSGSLSPELRVSLSSSTNKITDSRFSLSINVVRPDNIHFIPHYSVIGRTMSIQELHYALRTFQPIDPVDMSQEPLSIKYLDRLDKASRPVGVVNELGYIRIHHSQGVRGVFVLDLKIK